MGGGGGKGGKTETFIDVKIQRLYPDVGKPNHYQKQLLNAYMTAGGDSLATMQKMITNRSVCTNNKVLEKFGFKVVTGKSHKITEYSLTNYLLNKGFRNIILLYNMRLQYDLTGFYGDWSDHGGGCYASGFVYGHKWSYQKYEKVTWTDPCNEGCATHCIIYEWKSNKTRLVKYGLKQKNLTDPTAIIINLLKDDDNISATNDTFDYTYVDFHYIYDNYETKDNVTIQYHYYRYNGKTYKVLFSGSEFDYRYDQDNKVYQLHMQNVNDDNDVIWYTLPKSDRVYVIFSFKSDNSNEHKYMIANFNDILEEENDSKYFLWVDIKHDGNIVNYKDGYKATLKKFGLQLPEEDQINNSDLKDLSFTLSSTYATRYQNLDAVIASLYGSKENPNNIVIKTKNGDICYNHVAVYEQHGFGDNSYEEFVGYNWKITYKGYEITHNNYFFGLGGSSSNSRAYGISTEENKTPFFLIPLGPLKKLNMKDFYLMYYENLSSWAYMKKEVKLKWYQTMFFQFLLVAVTMVFCPTCAMVMMGVMIAEQAIINPMLKSMGVSDEAIVIIDAVLVIIAMSYAPTMPPSAGATQTGATMAESTASSSTASMSASTASSATTASETVGASGTASEATTATTSSTTGSSFFGSMNGSSMSFSQGVSLGLNVANAGANAYYQIKLDKDQKKIKDLADQNKQMQEQIQTEFGNRFLYRPFDMLDMYEEMRYMDVFDIQDMIDDPMGAISDKIYDDNDMFAF